MHERNLRAIKAFIGFVLVMLVYIGWSSRKIEAQLTDTFTAYIFEDID